MDSAAGLRYGVGYGAGHGYGNGLVYGLGYALGIVSGCALDTHAGDAGLMSRVLGLLTLWWSDRIGGRMGFGLIIGIWTGTWIYR